MELSLQAKMKIIERYCKRMECKNCPLFEVADDLDEECYNHEVAEKNYQFLIENGLIREHGKDYKKGKEIQPKSEFKWFYDYQKAEIYNFCKVHLKKGCSSCPLKNKGFHWCKEKNYIQVIFVPSNITSLKDYNEMMYKAWDIINDYNEKIVNKKRG